MQTPSLRSIASTTAIVAFVYCAGTASLLFSDIVLARVLEPVAFGTFAYVKQLTLLLMTVGFLGMDQALARSMGRAQLADFNWKRIWVRLWIPSVSTVICCATLLRLFQPLSPLSLATILLCSSSLTALMFISSFARAGGHFVLGQVVAHIWRFTLFCCVILLTALSLVNEETALWALTFSCVASALISTSAYFVLVRQGVRDMDIAQLYRKAVIFWLFGSSLSITVALDYILLARLANIEDVGTFSALYAVVAAPFVIFSAAAGYVAMPLVVRHGVTATGLGRLRLPFCLLILFSGVWIGLIDTVIWMVYGHRYSYSWSVPILMVIGGLVRTIYTIPSVLLGGKANDRTLMHFFCWAILGNIIHLVAGVILIPSSGLLGAAVAQLVDWGIRCAGGMIILSTATLTTSAEAHEVT